MLLTSARARPVALASALALSLAACGSSTPGNDAGGTSDTSSMAALAVSSGAIASGAPVPIRNAYTNCPAAAQNLSVPLSITNVPSSARSLAVILEDPDAGGFLHWSAWDIAPDRTSLAEGLGADASGMVQGQNDYGDRGYGGPCPPPGENHHYVFRVLALDVATLGLSAGATADAVRGALNGHVVAEAQLMSSYQW